MNTDENTEDNPELDIQRITYRLILADDDFVRKFIAPGQSDTVTDEQVEELRARIRTMMSRPN
jgi:hypothetical protein